MPKRELFYLSFQGSRDRPDDLSSSYWFSGTEPIPSKIPFATHRPRKLLPTYANLCLINYPFDLNDSYNAFENMKYKQYYPSQHLLYFRNKAIQEIRLFLKNVKCGSVIYLDFHGREGLSYFVQFVLIEHNNEKQELRIPIPAYKFARIIADAIPIQARKSIEFRFIVCCAETAPRIVMETLHHEFGFKKSCCIYYEDVITVRTFGYEVEDFFASISPRTQVKVVFIIMKAAYLSMNIIILKRNF